MLLSNPGNTLIGRFVGRFFCFLCLTKMKMPRTTPAVKIATVTTNRPAVTDSSMGRFDCIAISIGSCELVGVTELNGLTEFAGLTELVGLA